MQSQSRNRTLVVLLTLILLVAVNTVLGSALQRYDEWFAWTIYAVGTALVAVALRFQQRLSGAAMAGLLALPFVLAAIGAVIGIGI